MNNLIYNIAITQLPLIGDINAKKLIAYCGSTKEVFKQKLPHLIKIPGIGEATASAIVKGFMPALKRAEEEISFMEKNKIQSFYFLQILHQRVLIPHPPLSNSSLILIVYLNNSVLWEVYLKYQYYPELPDFQLLLFSLPP